MASPVVQYTFVAKDQFTRISKDVEQSFDRLDRKMRQVNLTGRDTDKSFRNLGSSAEKNLVAMSKRWLTVAAVVGTARKSISSAAAAQTALNKTLSNAANATIARELTPAVMQQIDVLRSLGFQIEEIDRALFKMTSQQGLTLETLSLVAGASKLAIGGYADLEMAISATNKQLEAFADLGGDSEKAARQIFEAQRIGDTSVAELAQNAPMASGKAGSMGLTSAEYLTTLSIFAKPLEGVNKVAVGLLGLLTEIQRGASAGQTDQIRVRKRLGLPVNEIQFMEQGGIVPFLEKVAALRSTDRGRLMLAKTFSSQEATRLLDFITPERLDELRSGISSVETGRNLDDAVARRQESLEVALNRLSASTDKLAAAFGVIIEPLVTGFSSALSDAVFDEGNPEYGLINTPWILGGNGGAADRALEMFSRTMSVIASPINAVSYATGLVEPKAKIDMTIKADGAKVERTSIEQDGLDIGVQEK